MFGRADLIRLEDRKKAIEVFGFSEVALFSSKSDMEILVSDMTSECIEADNIIKNPY